MCLLLLVGQVLERGLGLLAPGATDHGLVECRARSSLCLTAISRSSLPEKNMPILSDCSFPVLDIRWREPAFRSLDAQVRLPLPVAAPSAVLEMPRSCPGDSGLTCRRATALPRIVPAPMLVDPPRLNYSMHAPPGLHHAGRILVVRRPFRMRPWSHTVEGTIGPGAFPECRTSPVASSCDFPEGRTVLTDLNHPSLFRRISGRVS